MDKRNSISALKLLFEKGDLTETQKWRFKMYIFDNLSYREIVEIENVTFAAVRDSVNSAKIKLKKFFEKF